MYLLLTEQSRKFARRLLALLRFFSYLPLPLVHFIGASLGLVLSIVPNRSQAISLINIRLCYPSKDRGWQRKMMRKNLMETAKVFTELGPLWLWKKQRINNLVTTVYDQDVLDAALKVGRGLLIAVPHLGAWELVNPYLSARLPLTIMFRPSRIPELDPFIRRARQRFGAKLVPTDVSGIKAIVLALAKGEAAIMLPDQEPKRGNGCFAPFFAKPAYTPVLLSKLGRRKRVPVVFVVMERLSFGQGFRAHYLRAGNDIYDANPAVAAAAINRCVEKCISIAPEQYMWNYKRFQSLPNGRSRSYKIPLQVSIREQCDAIITPIVKLIKITTSGTKRRRRRR
jgi:KDO2-lipid IV(A) lauroyltransferase